MEPGYLSRDPSRLAELQRKRRSLMTRIDYMPSREAASVFKAKKGQALEGSWSGTNSAVLDQILIEWAEMTGINYSPLDPAMSLERRTSIRRAMSLASEHKQHRLRVPCGAKRHRDGRPCQGLSEPGKKRCRFHGGRSTGPKTPEGKARCTANLPNRTKEDPSV